MTDLCIHMKECELTNGQAVVPPIVGALLEAEARLVTDLLCYWRCTQGPRAQVDKHHQQYGKHPLQQLFVSELHLVRRFHPVR